MQSGRPFTVALLPEVDNSNTGRSSLGFGGNDRPNVSGNAAIDNPGPKQWFNTAAFSMPAFGTLRQRRPEYSRRARLSERESGAAEASAAGRADAACSCEPKRSTC